MASGGVTVFSWALPLPMELRVASPALLFAVLAAASHAGRASAATFARGMAATSGFLLAASGELMRAAHVFAELDRLVLRGLHG